MRAYDEIRDILVREFGFGDLDAYRKWIVEARPKLALTQDRIERLSPDVVDCRAFWRVCDDLFGVDPVCNIAVAPEVGSAQRVSGPMDANRLNLRLARSMGLIAFLEENARERLKTLEVGAGFGCLKNFIETETNHAYTGVDVVPRVPGVTETTADGLIPRELIEAERATYSYVVSSNVFQHLSARQRSQYYEDAHTLLHDGGLFVFNIQVDTGKAPACARDRKGNAWCDHYGQYTLMPKGSGLYEELSRRFSILYVTQRYDGLFNFACQKRPKSGES